MNTLMISIGKSKNSCTSERVRYSFLGSFIFSMAANAFAYFNFYPQHDSLNHAMYFAGSWEVQLGRFLLPFYGKLRGTITMPWLIGMLSILFIAGSTYVVSDLLNMDTPILIILTGGILAANLCVTELCAVFMFVTDAYMLSMFLGCLGVWIIVRWQSWGGVFLSAVLFFLSFGLYQSSASVVLVLFALLLIQECAFGRRIFLYAWRKWLRYALSLVLGVFFYVIGYKAALYLWDTTPAESSNSLSSLAELGIWELLQNLKNGYKQFLGFFFCDEAGIGTATQLCNILLVCLALFFLVKLFLQKKIRVINGLVAIGCIVLLPVMMLLMSIFMSKEAISFRTAYALFLLYPIMLSVIFHGVGDVRSTSLSSKHKRVQVVRFASLVAVCIVLFQNIRYSNGAYTVEKILYDRTTSVMTRILEDIEEEDGYVPGETEVVVIGGIYDGNSTITELTSQYSALGGFKKTSISYARTFNSMAKLLGSKLNIAEDSVIAEYKQMDEVSEMPAYPSNGYCQMIDERLVVKLSGNK
ncbi:MAG: glucosyltransferase domain-containing protein [Lachnospiraceae bacterium]|nr:glucosyltransferase domain-containing protein [Lachnospiraceae bacterium]